MLFKYVKDADALSALKKTQPTVVRIKVRKMEKYSPAEGSNLPRAAVLRFRRLLPLNCKGINNTA